MARVKMEEIVDHLSAEMKRALERAVSRTLPDVEFDRNKLYREFKRAVGAKCDTWERIPDHCVDPE